jgi:hypothetical protein
MFSLERRQEVERIIVKATIEAAIKRGFVLDFVNNGDDNEPVSTVNEAMDLAFACDDARIWFKGGPWLYIVLGNEGWTVISDYTLSIEEAVVDVESLVEKFEKEDAS